MKKKNNKKRQSNSAVDALIDFSEVSEEALVENAKETLVEESEDALAKELQESLAKEVQSTLVEQENNEESVNTDTVDTDTVNSDAVNTDTDAAEESGPTFIEIPNEGNSDIVVGTFLYTPSEEIKKELKIP